jgi:low temperature requirement protein LtrA
VADSEVPHSEEEVEEEYRVTSLELFFDLVFVFALTQVTALVAEDLTAIGMLRGLAVLMAVWWAWVGYAWLTNSVPIEDDDRARLVMFGAMTAMLVLALAIPHAFGDDGVLFGFSYLVVTGLFLVLYAVSTRSDPDMNRAVLRLAPGVLAAPVLVAIAGFFDAGPVRAALWVVALTVTFLAPIVSGNSGWRVRPTHFAERHGLIVIIALGESLVALGLAASGRVLTAQDILAASLGVLLLGCLWWLYFDVVSLAAERRLHEVTGEERNALARDSYSYIHLVMVVGIVMIALGLKKVLEYGSEPLSAIPAVTLFGGVAVYLLGHVAFRLRNLHTLNVQRLVVAVLLIALIPVGTVVSSYVSLAVVTAIATSLATYEAVKYSIRRQEIRHPKSGPTSG